MTVCASGQLSRRISKSQSRNSEPIVGDLALSRLQDSLYQNRQMQGENMSSVMKVGLFGAALALLVAGAGEMALAQDRETVLKNRQATMKEQGKDLGAVKAYLDGKGDLTQAKAGATNLTQTTK